MRRTLVLATAAIATLLLGSVALILRVTASSLPDAGASAEAPAPAGRVPAAPDAPAPPAVPQPPEATGVLAASARVVSPPPRAASAPGAARVQLSFRLDPRLTRGLQMGDRWVSPPTFSATGDARSARVQARARLVGGAPGAAPALAWTASEPDMVDVTPDQGAEVAIAVWREGRSLLTVGAGEVSTTLSVEAVHLGGALRVNITR